MAEVKLNTGLSGYRARVLNLPLRYNFRHLEQEEKGMRERRASQAWNHQPDRPKLFVVSVCKAEPGNHPQNQRFAPGVLTVEWFSASAAVVMIPLPRRDPVYSGFSSILFTWASPSGLSLVPQTRQPPFSLRDLHLLFPWIFTCPASPWHLGLSLNVSLAETLFLTILSKEATSYPPNHPLFPSSQCLF